MLEAELLDSSFAALAAMPARIGAALAVKAGALAAALRTRIQQKLAGEVLTMKSGALAASIGVTIDESSANVCVRITASADIKYAAIHEFGGTIPPHQIVPDKAKALAFVTGGKQAFAARAQIPAVRMPERSYMRSSLAEMAGNIRDELETATIEAMR